MSKQSPFTAREISSNFVKIGDSVYVISSPREAIGGMPALVCALTGSIAKVAIERDLGTKVLVVPLWDVLPARLFTAALLRIACLVYQRLERERGSLVGITIDELQDALAEEHLDADTAHMCAELSRGADWSSPRPLFSWLKAIRNFYYPRACA
jgi:hypothetical protein